MSILVNDAGFHEADELAFEVTPETDPNDVDLEQEAIAILFPSFSDGRGFGIAASLRRRGYRGKLRARGHILADQYAMARRVGFDEVEISEELAERQGVEQWQARANWQEHDYQARLGKMKNN